MKDVKRKPYAEYLEWLDKQWKANPPKPKERYNPKHPFEFLTEVLETMGLTLPDICDRHDSLKNLEQPLKEANLSVELCLELEHELRIRAEKILAVQMEYRLHKAREKKYSLL